MRRQFGLVGFPLEHSFSKRFFTDKFNEEHIDAQYDLFELDDLAAFPLLVDNPHLCGLNVTIPYKEKIKDYLNELDDTAAKIGAVNVIKIIRSGNIITLKGYNTDVIGFEKSLLPFLKDHHHKALIFGTGGAAKAVAYVFDKLGIKAKFVSRNSGKERYTYDQIDKLLLDDYKILVNASPVGTFPHVDTCPDIPYQYLDNTHLLYDLVYNPSETLFLSKGKEKGATIVNGEAMLIGQALAAWEIWNQK